MRAQNFISRLTHCCWRAASRSQCLNLHVNLNLNQNGAHAQDFISRLTHLLLEGGEQVGSEAHAQLVALIEANRWTVLSMATHDSRKLMSLTMAVKTISVAQAGLPPAGHHEAVLARPC